MNSLERKDVYTRVTDHIIADLEKGIRTWMKPWNVAHTAGRITKPLRHNGTFCLAADHLLRFLALSVTPLLGIDPSGILCLLPSAGASRVNRKNRFPHFYMR
jgi:N-terminal domain of anti-restriction factor ArdC